MRKDPRPAMCGDRGPVVLWWPGGSVHLGLGQPSAEQTRRVMSRSTPPTRVQSGQRNDVEHLNERLEIRSVLRFQTDGVVTIRSGATDGEAGRLERFQRSV